ncbi:MAG: hypothetical protein KJO91_00515, partial [Gammaproteobacteria bacterium]|nr:hypothetical protein [Gammaproteobacteria bacterium]
MTVRAIVPIIEYTGNGVITKYDWDWDMIEDSSINVLVDNINVFNWSLEGQSVVFDVAPEDGAEIKIYRRTTIWMPENYRAFGRFHSEKTELSVDRAILIAQERAGDRTGNAANGIVGGANLSITRGEYDLTVVSERGTDAVLPIYDYDEAPAEGNVVNLTDNVINGSDNVISSIVAPEPDSTIIWDGTQIYSGIYSLPGNTSGVAATIRFKMDLTSGEPDEASAFYPDYNAFSFAGWLNVDPNDDEYWMRVTAVGTAPAGRYTVHDGANVRVLGESFQMRSTEPYVSVYTFGDAAPSTQTGTFNIEICKDSGGEPDEVWASRTVTLEAIFNEEEIIDPSPDPDPEAPPDTTGAVSWETFFGNDFLSTISDATKVIPTEGVAIWFTVPATTATWRIAITSIEVTGLDNIT